MIPVRRSLCSLRAGSPARGFAAPGWTPAVYLKARDQFEISRVASSRGPRSFQRGEGSGAERL